MSSKHIWYVFHVTKYVYILNKSYQFISLTYLKKLWYVLISSLWIASSHFIPLDRLANTVTARKKKECYIHSNTCTSTHKTILYDLLPNGPSTMCYLFSFNFKVCSNRLWLINYLSHIDVYLAWCSSVQNILCCFTLPKFYTLMLLIFLFKITK